MDYSRDGSDAEKFTAGEISALKTSPGGSKTVLSYMNIGEAEDEMVDFVKSIASYARVEKGHPDFQVFVQNAEDLSRHPDYVQAVSGIGKEDLFYDGNSRQPAAETSYSIRQLDRFKAAGKPVFVIDYVTRPAKIDAFYEKAHARGSGTSPYAPRPRRSHHKPWSRTGLASQHAPANASAFRTPSSCRRLVS